MVNELILPYNLVITILAPLLSVRYRYRGFITITDCYNYRGSVIFTLALRFTC